MGKLSAFLFVSLDGYYKDLSDGISWHEHSEEGNQHSVDNLSHGNTLLFGRKTHDLMASFWPTPVAYDVYPKVAEGMNKSPKIVISSTLESSSWNNTKVFNDNWISLVRELKRSADITILGSGTILRQVADEGLLDQLSIMIDPIALGSGESIFKGLSNTISFKTTGTKTFRNGSVLIDYEI